MMEAQAQAQSAPTTGADISAFRHLAESTIPDPKAAPTAMTIEELIDFCLKLKPSLAAERRDSSLCVTPLITQLTVDGKLVRLELIDGRFGAGYVRVSDERQRSARSVSLARRQTQRRKDGQKSGGLPDGYSEEEQLNRQIRYFVSKGMAFRIYSDAGITGEYPIDDNQLIERLLEKKADRYRKVFTRTMLDETSLLRRTPEQADSMRAYLERAVKKIKLGALSELEAEESDEIGIRSKLRLRGRARSQVFFRQAFTQLWRDVEKGTIHTIAVSDRSRLCRDADLETAFLQILGHHGTRLHGCIEDLSSLDVSDPIKRGLSYLVASINEYRLEELSGHCLRGVLQALETGRPCGKCPWWMERDEDGRAVLIQGRDQIVQRIVELERMGLGEANITKKLRKEGLRVGGHYLTKAQIHYLISSEALVGVQKFYGLEWTVFPRMVSDETLAEIRALRDERSESMTNLHDERTWAEHLFTGVIKCACGKALIFNHQGTQGREAGNKGHYRCRTLHKKQGDGVIHPWMAESKLEAFFDELLSANPDIIHCALSAGNEKVRSKQAERAVVEARLQAARDSYNCLEAKVRVQSEETAKAMGISREAAAFEDLVRSLTSCKMETERGELDALQHQLILLGFQEQGDKQASRALTAAQDLRKWNDLDTLTKNRLMRALFEEVTLYPFLPNGERGYIDIKLTGVETHLPPVLLVRNNRKSIDIPTVGEWLDSIYSPTPPLDARSVRAMRSLSACRAELASVDGAQDLIDFCHEHKIHMNKKATLKSYQQKLTAHGADDRLMAVLMNVYRKFVEVERVRLDAAEPSPAE